jgi:hypothetical protein
VKIWTIYDRPFDHPEGYIARLLEVHEEGVVATENITGALVDIRDIFQRAGLRCISRDGDEPWIVESWVQPNDLPVLSKRPFIESSNRPRAVVETHFIAEDFIAENSATAAEAIGVMTHDEALLLVSDTIFAKVAALDELGTHDELVTTYVSKLRAAIQILVDRTDDRRQG